ncbi:MAG: HEAT repeat domain-containing protein, partial [Planctomycetota bacterium]
LEWMFVQAIKKVDPEFDYKPSDRMRAPRRLALGYELPTEPVAKAPSKEEIEEIIKDLKRGRGSWRDNWKKLPLIMLSDEKDAINFVKVTMSSRWISNNRRVQMLEGIGKSSPSDYYVVVEDYLEHEEADVREAAAVAMARLAEPKASRSLRKAMSKEEDVRLEGLQLRALASCAPKERSTSSLVEKAFGDKDEVLRMHAVVASGLIENRKVTEKVLTKALGDPAAKVRSTAAYVIGTRRITELIQALVLSSEAEADAEVKGYMTAAKELCEDKESKAFAGFLETVVGDKKSVYKPDEDWPFGPGPRNGGGDDEDPGKKKKKG